MITYPGFWFLLALLAGVLYIWLPFMILAVIGAVILWVLDVWKERVDGSNALGR